MQEFIFPLEKIFGSFQMRSRIRPKRNVTVMAGNSNSATTQTSVMTSSLISNNNTDQQLEEVVIWTQYGKRTQFKRKMTNDDVIKKESIAVFRLWNPKPPSKTSYSRKQTKRAILFVMMTSSHFPLVARRRWKRNFLEKRWDWMCFGCMRRRQTSRSLRKTTAEHSRKKERDYESWRHRSLLAMTSLVLTFVRWRHVSSSYPIYFLRSLIFRLA